MSRLDPLDRAREKNERLRIARIAARDARSQLLFRLANGDHVRYYGLGWRIERWL